MFNVFFMDAQWRRQFACEPDVTAFQAPMACAMAGST
jgi:hypothetical protein